MIKVLGLDLASTTGWSIIDSEHGLLAYGTVNLPATKPPHTGRFKAWIEEFGKLLEEHQPDMVSIEELHKARNMNTAKILIGLLTVTVITAPEGLPVIMCHQGTAKKDIVKPVLGRAKLDKEDVFQWATDKYSLDELTFNDHNDITDAILVASWGIFKFDSEA